MIFPLITYLLACRNCSTLYVVVYRPQCMVCSVSPAEHGSIILSVHRHWRFALLHGGMARRNALDSTGVMSVVSTRATVTDTESAASNFQLGSSHSFILVAWVTHDAQYHARGLQKYVHANDVYVIGTSPNWNTRQNKLIIGSIHCPVSAHDQCLSLIRLLYHVSAIATLLKPRKVSVNGGNNSKSVYLLRTITSSVE